MIKFVGLQINNLHVRRNNTLRSDEAGMLKISEDPCLHSTCIDFQYGEIQSCQGVIIVDDENLHSSSQQKKVLWDGLCLSAPTFFFFS